jgi:hypothetical protein
MKINSALTLQLLSAESWMLVLENHHGTVGIGKGNEEKPELRDIWSFFNHTITPVACKTTVSEAFDIPL